ncbi:POL [Symbiodinium sp. CCMP2592]|nr:POL [Symbiodinium sp. CCMP2592]
MPRYCHGFEDPSGDGARPCIFSQDGRGGPAQTSNKSCVLCSLESLELALGSRVARGNLIRQLKHWRQVGSPTYEAAFGLGSLCVLSASEQCGLRAKAGERRNFKPSSSWLHKKQRRLRQFLLGRAIPRTSLSTRSRKYVQSASSQRSGGQSWILHYYSVHNRKMAHRLATALKKVAGGTVWKGKKASLRGYRQRWWRARRELRRRYSELMAMAEGPLLSCRAAKWAIEEDILQAGFRVPLSDRMSCQNHPQWRFLAETGHILYFQSPHESLDFAQKQLASATCSINNALGRPTCDITLQTAQRLLKARGSEHDWRMCVKRDGKILSPFAVGCALEQIGFKLQYCSDPSIWPAGAQSLLQIRGDQNSGNEHWAALTSCDGRIYVLDCFQGKPELVMNWHPDLQPCETYAVRILKKKKAGSGNEAVQARLHGVPGREVRALADQVRDLGPKKVKVGCLKPEEGDLQEEATTSSKDLLSEYVLGAWSQPEEDRGGDKAGVPILNQYGVPGARSQLEEDGGGNQDGGEERPECLSSTKIGSQVHGFILEKRERKLNLKKTEARTRCGSSQVEEDRGNGKVWELKPKKTEVCGLSDKAERAYPVAGWHEFSGKVVAEINGVRILKKKKAGSGNEAVQARLHGVPGAWSQSKKAEAGTRPAQYGVPGAWSQPEEGGGGDEAGAGVPGAKAEAGTRPERLSSTNVESQVRDLGPKKVKVGCLKPEEGELQEEATTSSKDLLSEYVLCAWSQPEEDRGGDKVRGLNLKRMEAGTRPEHFSSTNIGSEVRGLNSNRCMVSSWGKEKGKDKAGVRSAWPQEAQAEEDRGKNEVWKFKLKKTQAWKLKLKKGKDKVRILKKKKAGSGNEAVQARLHGVPGAWSQSKKAEAGTRCVLSRTRPAQYRIPGAWSQPEEGGGGDEAGTRPERLSSTNVESQVRDLGPKKVKVGCLKPEEGELQEEATTGSKDLLSEYVLGAWSQPEEDGGGDKAGSPILNCHGFPGSWSGENRSRDQAGVPILKQYGVPGARSQLEEDGGGNQAGALVLNQYRVRGAWSQLEQDGGEERPEYLCKDKAGRAHPQPTWGSEVRKFKLKKTQVWKFKLKKTEAWKLKLKKGKDKAWKLKLKETEAWKLKLKKGKNKAWKLKLKETEARTRQGQGREDLSSTNMGFRGVEAQAEEGQEQGMKAQAEEDRGKDKAWTLKRKKTEARRRPGVDAQAEEDGGKDQAWKLKRKKTEARTRRTLKETESPKASHGECKEYARYLGIDPGYEGEETHNAMLCPSLGAWSQPEKNTEAGIRCDVSQPEETGGGDEAGTTGSQSGEGEGGEEVRGLNLKKAEGTRPEGLSSTNMGSQPEEGEGGDEAGVKSHPGEGGGGDEAKAIILNKSGVRGVKSHPGEGGGGDEAKALILNQYGVLGACSDSPKKAEAGCVVSQPEEGGGGDEARTRPESLSSTNMGFQGKRGVEAQDEEDRGKDEVWKHKLKKTEVRGLNPKETRAWLCKELCVSTREAVAQENLPKSDKARRDLRSVQQDPAMLSEQSSGRYIVSDDVELPEDRVQYSDVNLLRQALLDAREFLRSGYTEIHFRVWRRDEPMKLLCARSAKQHEGTMELYLTYEDGGEEEGLLHPAGTGCTGPLFAFASRRQDGIPAPRRRLGRAHTIFFFKNDLVEWTAKRCKEGLVHHMRPRSSIMSQSGIQVLSLSGNNVGGGDTDESRRLACREIRLSSTNTASQVLRKQGQSAMGLGVRGPSPKKAAGTRLERLSSTTVGFEISSPEAEEGEGGDEAGALILNQDGVSGAWSEAEKTAEAGALIINQDGVSGAWFEAEKTAEAGTRPERLSSTKMGSRVRGLKPKTAEAGTRPERLSSTKMGSQVRGLKPKKAKAGTRPERLSSTKMGCQVLGLKLRRRRR